MIKFYRNLTNTINRLSTRQMQMILFLFDVSIVFLANWLATLLRYDGRIPADAVSVIFICTAISIPIVTVFSLIFGCYREMWRYAGFDAMVRQAGVTAVNMAVLLVVKYFFITDVSGSITVVYGVLLFMLTGGIRVLPRLAIWSKSFLLSRQDDSKRAVIVGGGNTGAMLVRQVRDTGDGKAFFPVAIVDNDPDKLGLYINGVKIVGNIDSIEEVCKTFNAGKIIVALPNASKEELFYIYKKCINSNLPIYSSQSMLDVKDSLNEDGTALRLVTIEDLLFREVVESDMSAVREFITGRTVMVTGGAGSIGSELCRQVLECGCGQLIVYDFNENGLYDIDEEFSLSFGKDRYELCLGSIRDVTRLNEIMGKYKPHIVYHAAAHKHVPMLELNPFEAVKNNVMGTMNVINACIENGAGKFVLISTDKAVNPVNVLGATKRVAEMMVENMKGRGTELTAVRFGNVLGSIGSVIPKFKRQIAAGGPVTVTHEEIVRYFMTTSEAVSLVLTAGTLAKDGEIFVLDMGQPVKIIDLATDLIRLSGYVPGVDIKVDITGLRPGEKLYEDLFTDDEEVDSTSHEKIFVLRDKGGVKGERAVEFEDKYNGIVGLAVEKRDEKALREALFALVGGHAARAAGKI